ncbi:TLC domain-containing protein [Apiospora marii]|uniref:TLC domain-containing protein n=1 Tax=Apiospora marii TaxID=335849 RepID=UPI00312F942B
MARPVRWDLGFVGSHNTLLTCTNDSFVHELPATEVRSAGDSARERSRMRLAEQMYPALFIAVVGPWGTGTCGPCSDTPSHCPSDVSICVRTRTEPSTPDPRFYQGVPPRAFGGFWTQQYRANAARLGAYELGRAG